MSRYSLPRRRTAGRERQRRDGVGALLAVGASSRYGNRNKLLALLDEDPLVVHAARTFVESTVMGVTVVDVGYESERVREALAGLDVAVRENEAYEAGRVPPSVRRSRPHTNMTQTPSSSPSGICP